MKIVILLLSLAAVSLAYPVAENEEKPSVPLVITDYASVAKSDEVQPERAVQHDSSESSSSEESSERPSEPAKPVLEEQKPLASNESSEESSESKPLQDEKPVLAEESKPLLPEAAEKPVVAEPLPSESKPVQESLPVSQQEPKLEERLKEEIKEPLPETKVESVPEVKSVDPIVPEKVESLPSVKSITEEKVDIVETAHKPASVAEESVPAPAVKSEIPEPEKPLEKSSEEIIPDKIEKPLALPTLKADDKLVSEQPSLPLPAPAATEIKEEVVLPSEQKVEVKSIAEEKVPETKSAEKLPEPVIPEKTEEKNDVPALVEAKPELLDDKKKAKSEGEIKTETRPEKPLDELVQEPLKPELKPTEEKPLSSEPKLLESENKPILEPKLESSSALPAVSLPAELPPSTLAPVLKPEPVPINQQEESKLPLAPSAIPEKLPEPSSASS